MLFADPTLVSRQLLDDLLKYKRLDGVTELLGALGGRRSVVAGKPSSRCGGWAACRCWWCGAPRTR